MSCAASGIFLLSTPGFTVLYKWPLTLNYLQNKKNQPVILLWNQEMLNCTEDALKGGRKEVRKEVLCDGWTNRELIFPSPQTGNQSTGKGRG